MFFMYCSVSANVSIVLYLDSVVLPWMFRLILTSAMSQHHVGILHRICCICCSFKASILDIHRHAITMDDIAVYDECTRSSSCEKLLFVHLYMLNDAIGMDNDIVRGLRR